MVGAESFTRWSTAIRSASYALGLAVMLSACSPALNWRRVPVAQLAAQLPCKPDHAQRDVALGGVSRKILMWGCDADGALYAVSYLQAVSQADAAQAAAAWQEAALRKLPGAPVERLEFNAPPLRGSAEVLTASLLEAKASGADGRPLQARWAWLVRGDTVYHLAVFAPALGAAHTDPFFTELQWQ